MEIKIDVPSVARDMAGNPCLVFVGNIGAWQSKMHDIAANLFLF